MFIIFIQTCPTPFFQKQCYVSVLSIFFIKIIDVNKKETKHIACIDTNQSIWTIPAQLHIH